MTFSYTFNEASGHISINEGSTKIPYAAFHDYEKFHGGKIRSVYIPNSVTEIGENAFSSNNLTEINIPNSVTTIGRAAFYQNNLTEIIIPNSVTEIGRQAFLLNSLTSLAIPDSVISIGGLAFAGNNLSEVVIPDSVTSLGNYAFTTNNVAEVELPSRFRETEPGIRFFDFSTNITYREEKIAASTSSGIEFTEGNVYRLRNDSTGKFIFSANSGEIDIITGQGWVNEGAAYSSPTNATTDLHRFLMSNGGHFYTANTFEKNILLQDSSFTYEGIAYQVYSTAEPPQGSIPVIRYLSSSGSHLYSTSQYEQSILDASSQWVNEGIAWYGEAI
jgi:hypothetical protein